ncbi:MAG: helix-turn-helix domain-containing protein [Phyllobacteriaceae bacterium]|jgi:transcriptional regulator with XRE-family HTH domain|nr:helix-turn-helix domain-containing protein [Phyllobacteriaceae bacterium]
MMAKSAKTKAEVFQNPHQTPHPSGESNARFLEEAIGREVKRYREKMGLTIAELAKAADLSAGMLSKIENGATSPSLATLQALSKALQVTVTALFKGYEEFRDASFVKAGQGLTIERRGTRAGHQYQLLGHSPHGPVMVEPYMITLTKETDVFPTFQHAGAEFLYMIEGNVVYRHGDKTFDMHPGDALFFDAEAPHGPEELKKLPARYISVISYRRDE